jgi:hypothetical protein
MLGSPNSAISLLDVYTNPTLMLLQVQTGIADVNVLLQVGFREQTPQAFAAACRDEESMLLLKFKEQMVQYMGVPHDAVDVMDACLKVNPAKRATMEAALGMTYFKDKGLYPEDVAAYAGSQPLKSTVEISKCLKAQEPPAVR